MKNTMLPRRTLHPGADGVPFPALREVVDHFDRRKRHGDFARFFERAVVAALDDDEHLVATRQGQPVAILRYPRQVGRQAVHLPEGRDHEGKVGGRRTGTSGRSNDGGSKGRSPGTFQRSARSASTF